MGRSSLVILFGPNARWSRLELAAADDGVSRPLRPVVGQVPYLLVRSLDPESHLPRSPKSRWLPEPCARRSGPAFTGTPARLHRMCHTTPEISATPPRTSSGPLVVAVTVRTADVQVSRAGAHHPDSHRGRRSAVWSDDYRLKPPSCTVAWSVMSGGGNATISGVVEPLGGEAEARRTRKTACSRALSAADARRAVVHGMERRPVAAAVAHRLVVDVKGAARDANLVGKAHATDIAAVVPRSDAPAVPSAWVVGHPKWKAGPPPGRGRQRSGDDADRTGGPCPCSGRLVAR